MKVQVTLSQAIQTLYGNSLAPIHDIASEWSLFSPYEHKESKKLVYLRIEEIPTYYHTSSQIADGSKKKYGNLLHNVEVTLVERCFQSTFYLLKSTENIISLKGFIQFKKDCQETIESSFILKFLEFISNLRREKFFHKIKLDIDSIGVDLNGNYKLTDFSLFFHSEEELPPQSVEQSLLKILSNMVTLSSQILTQKQLMEKMENNYDKKILKVVEESLKADYSSKIIHQAIQQAHSTLDIDVKTTLTDSFLERIEKIDLTSQFIGESHISMGAKTQNQSRIKTSKTIKRMKLGVVCIICLVLFSLITLITLYFLKNSDVSCQEGEYYDEGKSRCLSCSFGCLRCKSGLDNHCYSCVGSMYKILKNYEDQMGVCSFQCRGTLIKANLCVDPSS